MAKGIDHANEDKVNVQSQSKEFKPKQTNGDGYVDNNMNFENEGDGNGIWNEDEMTKMPRQCI